MSTSNPTSLRIGMSGSLSGRKYAILGRVVLGLEEGGQTWYWNEFFLKSSEGAEATLVFEDTEAGPIWRFFEYFEPARPFSVVEASRIRSGTTVEIDGLSGVVDRVDKSRVYHIEGQAPEGVEVGDLSTYFNVDMKDSTLVVSWSGSEVEHYWGQNLPRSQVISAFGAAELPTRPSHTSALASNTAQRSHSGSWTSYITYGLLALFAAIWFFTKLPSCSTRSSSAAAPAARALPERILQLGSPYQFDGHDYSVKAEFLVEYASPSHIRHGRLYKLETYQGRKLTIIEGIETKPTELSVLNEQSIEPALVPSTLAALRPGNIFLIETESLSVKQLFRLRIYSLNTSTGGAATLAETRYGFTASNAHGNSYHLDWDEKEVAFSQVTLIKPSTSSR